MEPIDITEVASGFRDSFVAWGATYLFGELTAVSGLSWLGWPVVSALVQAILLAVLDILTKSVIMEAFFLATATQKASEAGAFQAAVLARAALPSTATDEEYRHAEEAQMLAFCALVRVS